MSKVANPTLKNISQEIENTLKMPAAGTSLYDRCMALLDFKGRGNLKRVVSQVCEVDAKIFSLASKTARLATEEAGKLSRIKSINGKISDLLDKVGDKAIEKIDKYTDSRNEVVSILGLPGDFDTLSEKEKKDTYKKCFSSLSKEDKRWLEASATQLKVALGEVRTALNGIIQVEEKIADFDKKVFTSVNSMKEIDRSIKLSIFNGAIQAYEAVINDALQTANSSGKSVQAIVNALERGGEKVLKSSVTDKLQSQQTIKDATDLVKLSKVLQKELQGQPLDPADLATLKDGRKIVTIDRKVLKALADRFNKSGILGISADIDIELAKASTNPAGAATALEKLLPKLQEQYDSVASVFNKVCETFAKTAGHQEKTSDPLSKAASTKSVPASLFPSALVEGLKDLHWGDATADTEIDTKCKAAEETLLRGITSKVEDILKHGSSKLEELAKELDEVPEKALAYVTETALKTRLKLGEHIELSERLKLFDELEKEIKNAF